MTTKIDEQNEEPEIAKNKYKLLSKFAVSKEWEWIVKAYEIQAGILSKEAANEFATRKKAVVTNTECEKLNAYIEFLKKLSDALPKDVEGAQVFADELQIQVERGQSHVYGKVEIGFDTPMYTKFDMMKNLVNAHLTISRKLSEVISLYEPNREERRDSHPYEEI